MTTKESIEYIGMLLWDVLQELRQMNGKTRNTPDTFCENCGEMIGTEHPETQHEAKLS